MKELDQLSPAEAVYTLYRAGEPHGESLDLDNEDSIRSLVTDALFGALGRKGAEAVMARLADDAGAGEVARAALAVVQQRADLAGPISGEATDLLESPPRPDKLDFGVSLGALCLAALAMVFMGSFEYERKQKGTPSEAGHERSIRVSFKGSEHVAGILREVFAKLRITTS